jgi:hypothetical protein
MTRNADANDSSSSYLRFSLDRAASVYVAYDAAAAMLPGWMTGFADTGLVVGTSNAAAPTMKLYVKTVNAGSVTLGGNLNSPAAGAKANYVVVVVEK